jgi:hypothetical protein
MPIFFAGGEGRRIRQSDDNTVAVFEADDGKEKLTPDPAKTKINLMTDLLAGFGGSDGATVNAGKLKEALAEFPESEPIEFYMRFQKVGINTCGPLFLLEGKGKSVLLAGHGKRDFELVEAE